MKASLTMILGFGLLIIVLIGANGERVGTPDPLTMTDAHYFVSGALCDSKWGNASCWSHARGGGGGAGVPTTMNDAVFDVNSITGTNIDLTADSFARRVILEPDLMAFDVTIALNSFNLTVQQVLSLGDGEIDILLSSSTKILSFSNRLDGSGPGQLAISRSGPGTFKGHIRYTGLGNYGVATNVSFFRMDASGAPTIYCYLGCLDLGQNVNIVFGSPPSIVISTNELGFVEFLLFIWLVFLAVGLYRVTPLLFLAGFVGMALAYQSFVRYGDVIVPLVLAAVNLLVIAYGVDEYFVKMRVER